jgi:hypothetical protein
LVLVDDPFEGRAVAEAVVERFGRDCGERERGIYREAQLVLAESHLVFDAVAERYAGGFDEVEIPGFEFFIIQMQLGQLLAGLGKGPEARGTLTPTLSRSTGRGRVNGGEGDAGQLALEVIGVLPAIAGMVQQAIDVVEDGPLGDRPTTD